MGGKQGSPPKFRSHGQLKRKAINALFVVNGKGGTDVSTQEPKSEKRNSKESKIVAVANVDSRTVKLKMKELFGTISTFATNEVSPEGAAEKLRTFSCFRSWDTRERSVADRLASSARVGAKQ